METKICSKCGNDCNLDEFDKRKDELCGYRTICKSCRRTYMNKYRSQNREKDNERRRKKYWENHEEELIRSKRKGEKDKEKRIEYRKINRKRTSEKMKIRYHNDDIFRIKTNIRNRMRLFLKKHHMVKLSKTFEIVGCSPEELKEHLEKQFIEGMLWENYGFYGWHIDHKIPLDYGKTEDEIYKLCHYTNLQPLWANKNLQKSNKLI